ncbi:MAG: type III secretion system export apparatus subunit SctT [Endozoicomonadaceae bacterium]|nr:type III secretion system export apparatus subunit SctT [Endozoicomonadaceae bacterium]
MDNQRGASMASTMNPMSGSDSSPMGILFSQTFTAIYLISGLFILMLKSIFLSYQVWPIFSFYPQLNPNTVMFILGQFDLIITWAVWLAAPIVICMFITEFGIALISRSAPQLNVFILAMPIKSAVAVAILTIYIGTIMALGKKGVLNFPGLLKQLNVLVS